MVELVIFDWDDVFTLGSTAGYFACYHAAASGVGVELTSSEVEQRIRSRWGQPVEEELRALLPVNPELVSEAGVVYESHLFGATFASHLSLVPGAIELLRLLEGHVQMSVATGLHPRVLQEQVMPRFQVPHVFEHVLSVYDVAPEHAKPSPFMVQELLRRHQLRPEQAVVVGDSPGDMKMARKAGVEGVAVLTGHLDRTGAEALGVRHILDRVTDLPGILPSLGVDLGG